MKHLVTAKTAIGLIALLIFLLPSRAIFAQPAPNPEYQPLPPDQLDNLTAPIALYPDALLSEILVASTYPQDVVQASQWIAAGNDPATIDPQPWDPSVKGLAHYPGLLAQLSNDAAWLNNLGAAFINQQPDVMASVQRLRAQAIAAGTLYSGPQQQVVQDGAIVEIIPTDPGNIYCPVYDPSVAFVAPDFPAGTVVSPCITFGPACAVGVWLGWDWDWYDNCIYVGSWGRDRPWWNWHDRDHLHYENYRPGHFAPPPGARWAPARWSRDHVRPLPVFHPGPSREIARRPLGGDKSLPGYDRGPDAVRDADRGRVERAAPVREAPFHEAPVRDVPAHEAPVREAPPPHEAPHEAPHETGGAMGYGRGDDAARAADRGAASRGGGHR